MTGIPIFLKSNDGETFVSTSYNQNAWLIADSNATKLGEWEKFVLEPLGGNKVALKSSNGNYVGAKYNIDQGQLIADTRSIGEWERFELVNAGDNRVALKSYRGYYVSLRRDKSNRLIADPNATTIQDWEKFQIGIREQIKEDGSKSYEEIFPNFDRSSSSFGTLSINDKVSGSCVICYLQYSMVSALFLAIGYEGSTQLKAASKVVEAIATVFGADKDKVLSAIRAMSELTSTLADPLEWPGYFCKKLEMCS